LLENGLSVLLDETGGHLLDEKIPHGDVMIDGIGVGDVGDNVIADRQKARRRRGGPRSSPFQQGQEDASSPDQTSRCAALSS
jgi:hypothetical protein